MPGATLQLVTYGEQDLYLTGNPQITYFKVVYRRHTNFSMEDIVINTINNPNFSGQVIQKIDKLGDLFHKVNFVFKGDKVYAGHGLANPSTALINYVGLTIGGHEIDRQYGHWMETYYELTKPNPNGTISNISKIDDTSISHTASNEDLALSQFYAKNASDAHPYYFDNRLNKLTNIFGPGFSYPPTKFQRSSRSGGVYCEPTYLQELETGFDEIGESFDNASMIDDSQGPASFSFKSVNTDGSQSDYSITSATINASITDGQRGSTSASHQSASFTVASRINTKKSLFTGSILGRFVLEIPFYMSKDPGLALPLIAIQNQEIQLDINFASSGDADWSNHNYDGSGSGVNYLSTNGTISNTQNVFNAHITNDGNQILKPIRNRTNNTINMNIDISVLYIYLDTDERRRFAEVSHEYLIEQVQYITTSAQDANIDISGFSHPVKEIIWTGKPYNSADITYAENTIDSTINASFLNNGKKVHKSGVRFVPGNNDNILGGSIKNSDFTLSFGNASGNAALSSSYSDGSIFSSDGKYVAGLIGPSTPTSLDMCDWSISLNNIDRISPKGLEYFTRYNVDEYHTGYGSVSCPDSIAVYSFALKPEEHQPSGSCNFSKLDKAFLHRYKRQTTNNDYVKLNIYAVNYNILRIMSGMAAIAYTL